jgi:hypothetical protein
VRRLLFVFFAGVAFTYYLDPECGHARRVRARERIAAGLRHLSRRTGRALRYTAGLVLTVAEMGSRSKGRMTLPGGPRNAAQAAARPATVWADA